MTPPEQPDLASQRTRAAAALERGDIEQALQELSALEADVERAPETARLWLDVLRCAPRHGRLEEIVTRVLARWPHDPALVTRACDALIRRAELAAPDEPSPLRDRLASIAARAAESCLVSRRGAPGASGDEEMDAFLLCAQGNALRLAGDPERALACLHEAASRFPSRAGVFFNLGLLYKTRHEWAEGLEAFQRARTLMGDERGVLWNVALCATALGRGELAVEALQRLGHRNAELASSGMPYVPNLPPVSIRVASIGSGVSMSAIPDRSVGFEALWVTPLSPCHGVVSSATFRDASVDYGDVVLWDGVPIGTVIRDGKTLPRFPLLTILRKGREHRLRFIALAQEAGQVAELEAELGDDARIFIHEERVETFCPRCASGEHMLKHRHEPAERHRVVQGKLVVSESADLAAFRTKFDAILRRHSGIQLVVPRLLELVGDTQAAGVAHRLWRALQQPRSSRPPPPQ